MATKVLKAMTRDAAAAAAGKGAKALKAGKLVAFATETVYGVGAVATDPAAVDRLRKLKSRPKLPFSVHLGRPEDARRYVAEPCRQARRLIMKAWPGPVTILLPTGGSLADGRLEKASLHDALTHRGMIGLRCPDEPVATALLSSVAAPVVASSANRAKAPAPRSARDVLKALDDEIDLLIDSGPTLYGKDSTVVSFAGEAAEVVREGVLDARAIDRLLRPRLLFVCAGNTCRSAMAAGLAAKLLSAKPGRSGGRPRGGDVEVVSAGVFASAGIKAPGEALRAAKELGADISRHQSQRLTKQLIRSADVIFCMTASQAAAVLRLVPAAVARTARLDEKADIADPIGRGQEVYRATAERIRRALEGRLQEVLTGGRFGDFM